MPQSKVICVITGAKGFIGSALSKKLSAESTYKVYPLDHKMLLSKIDLDNYFKKIKPDYIFHLSAYGNHSTQTDDEETFQANVIGTFNLLEATKDINYKAFINFGSSSEYGQKNAPMSERDLPEALTMYGCTKIAGTYLARAFAKKYNKPIVTVRPFSVYGPGEADHRFIPTIIRSLLHDKVIDLEAKATHDWIYIDDFLAALGPVIDNVVLLSGQAVNIGTGDTYRNEFIVTLLEKISGKRAKIKLTSGSRVNDSSLWMANIKKLEIFNWYHKWSIDGGLFKTYQYYKDKYYGN